MGAPKSKKSVHGRVSSTLERLERLMGDDALADIEHQAPETVEDSVRRLKGRHLKDTLPDAPTTPSDDG